jgi:hypothetical protein
MSWCYLHALKENGEARGRENPIVVRLGIGAKWNQLAITDSQNSSEL